MKWVWFFAFMAMAAISGLPLSESPFAAAAFLVVALQARKEG